MTNTIARELTMPRAYIRQAIDHASSCLNVLPTGWDEETLSHNVESNFPSLTDDECEAIARIALGGQHPIDRDHDRELLGIAS